jgi:hypothetical protein
MAPNKINRHQRLVAERCTGKAKAARISSKVSTDKCGNDLALSTGFLCRSSVVPDLARLVSSKSSESPGIVSLWQPRKMSSMFAIYSDGSG